MSGMEVVVEVVGMFCIAIDLNVRLIVDAYLCLVVKNIFSGNLHLAWLMFDHSCMVLLIGRGFITASSCLCT